MVGETRWLPAEPFEHRWAMGVGCNNLRCSRCGAAVQMSLRGDGSHRRYACTCQHHEEAGNSSVSGDPSELTFLPDGWQCGGHPDFELPAQLDGVALAEDADWGAVVRTGLTNPPFLPPRIDLPSVWAIRLYRLLSSETARARLAEAVVELAFTGDAAETGAALDFLIREAKAPEVARMSALLAARRDWLAATRHPVRAKLSLLEVLAVLLQERARFVDDADQLVDPEAMRVTKELALEGIGPGMTPYLFHAREPDWLWANAAALVRARAEWLSRIVHLSVKADSSLRLTLVRSLAGISDALDEELRTEIADDFEGAERDALLAAAASPSA